MPSIPKKDIPRFVRRCYYEWRTATVDLRQEEDRRLGFYVGGEKQWRAGEVSKRKEQGRPILTDNRIKPAVDQVEGDIRANPPGPKVLPIGEGADGDTADIHAGLIRECEHRSNAQVAYILGGRYQAISGYGVIELGTEYISDRSDEQQCVILPVEDPATWFFDPAARMLNRQDARWGGKIKQYSREQYEMRFGKNRVALKDRLLQSAGGWLQDAFGVNGNLSQINEWTGGGRGPYFVCEFYLVETDPVKLYSCSDHVNRFADEDLPRGVDRIEELRTVERRKITKYLVDAFEVADETEWPGTIIPGIPILGQEVYINGKLYRLSLISEALDSQAGLNYTITTASELAGLMPKAPFIGAAGSFEDERWQSANAEVWAYLEYTPVHAIDPVTGVATLVPPPQRNTWETPIQWLLALAQSFIGSIEGTTSIYADRLGASRGDKSGRAITSLQSQSSTGTFFIADNLHHSIQVLYEQIILVNTQIMNKRRVVTIVRPDSEHELTTINAEFSDKIDPASGLAAKAAWLNKGRYAVAVTVGPNPQTRKERTSMILTEFLKVDPQIMQVPGVAASALRSISEGDPEVEAIADLLEPQDQQNPQQLQQQLQQEQQKTKVLTLVVQKMQQEAAAKLPQIEADKFKALLDSYTKLAVAEVNASKDADRQKADILAGHIEQVTDLAHDTAKQAVEHEHGRALADQTAANTMAQQQQAADLQPEETAA